MLTVGLFFLVAFWVFLTHSLAYPMSGEALAREMWLLLLIYFNWIETATRPPISISDILPRILWAYLYQPVGQACETVCLADLFGVDVMEQCPDKRTTVVMLDLLHGMESRWRSPTQMYWIDLQYMGHLPVRCLRQSRVIEYTSCAGCTSMTVTVGVLQLFISIVVPFGRWFGEHDLNGMCMIAKRNAWCYITLHTIRHGLCRMK